MVSSSGVRRLALSAAGGALTVMGFLAVHSAGNPGSVADSVPAPLAPTTSTAESYAPENPVDCTDPNNAVNCQTPPIDSPLVVGTAEPGSPFRD